MLHAKHVKSTVLGCAVMRIPDFHEKPRILIVVRSADAPNNSAFELRTVPIKTKTVSSELKEATFVRLGAFSSTVVTVHDKNRTKYDPWGNPGLGRRRRTFRHQSDRPPVFPICSRGTAVRCHSRRFNESDRRRKKSSGVLMRAAEAAAAACESQTGTLVRTSRPGDHPWRLTTPWDHVGARLDPRVGPASTDGMQIDTTKSGDPTTLRIFVPFRRAYLNRAAQAGNPQVVLVRTTFLCLRLARVARPDVRAWRGGAAHRNCHVGEIVGSSCVCYSIAV